MTRENNAKFHIDRICGKCPLERKKLIEVNQGDGCYWNKEWSKWNNKILRSFGILNYFTQYIFGKTDLDRYQ